MVELDDRDENRSRRFALDAPVGALLSAVDAEGRGTCLGWWL
jgi:hypothetical protein